MPWWRSRRQGRTGKAEPVPWKARSGAGDIAARRKRGSRKSNRQGTPARRMGRRRGAARRTPGCRSEEHTSELQSLMRISYAVFCLKKKTKKNKKNMKHIKKKERKR